MGSGWTWPDRFATGQTSVPSVRSEGEELPVDQCLEYQIAHRAVDAAQTLELFSRQTQTGHLQILGANAFDQIVNR